MKTGVLLCALMTMATPAFADWKDDILAAHNAVRAAVHVPPLAWSDDLAAQAQTWAEFLAETDGFQHSPGWMLTGEGENIFLERGTRLRPQDMVGMWRDEKTWYNGGPITATKTEHHIGHYTQLVWRNAKWVGCGRTTAPDKKYGTRTYLVCRYSPPGNIIGQRPY